MAFKWRFFVFQKCRRNVGTNLNGAQDSVAFFPKNKMTQVVLLRVRTQPAQFGSAFGRSVRGNFCQGNVITNRGAPFTNRPTRLRRRTEWCVGAAASPSCSVLLAEACQARNHASRATSNRGSNSTPGAGDRNSYRSHF